MAPHIARSLVPRRPARRPSEDSGDATHGGISVVHVASARRSAAPAPAARAAARRTEPQAQGAVRQRVDRGRAGQSAPSGGSARAAGEARARAPPRPARMPAVAASVPPRQHRAERRRPVRPRDPRRRQPVTTPWQRASTSTAPRRPNGERQPRDQREHEHQPQQVQTEQEPRLRAGAQHGVDARTATAGCVSVHSMKIGTLATILAREQHDDDVGRHHDQEDDQRKDR